MEKLRQASTEESFSSNSASIANETVAKLFQKSEELKKKGQLDQALKTLNTLVSYNTNTEEIYLARAEIYRQKNQLSSALADLNRVITANSKNIQAYILRAEVYRLDNQPKKALNDLNQALALEPDNASIFGKRGTLYRSLDKFESALKDYNQAIQLDPTNAWLYGNRAETYRAINEHRKALNDYNKTLKLNPAATWVYERRSHSNLWLGYISAAQADFQQSWELNPANLMNGWLAEWTEMYKKDFLFSGEFEKRLENIARSNPEDPVAFLCRAVILIRRSDFTTSYNLCETACTLAPEEPAGYFWKAMAAAGLKKEKEAFNLLQTALDLNLRPIFLPPPAWLDQVNLTFHNKLAQQLFEKPRPRSSESELKLVELTTEVINDTPESPEVKKPVLKIVGSDFKPAEQTLEVPGLKLALQPEQTAPEPPEPGEALGPVQTPEAGVKAPQKAKAIATAEATVVETPAIPGPNAPERPEQPTKAELAGEALNFIDMTPPQKEKPAGLSFNFFRLFLLLAGLLIVCLLFYFLLGILPALL